MTDEQIKALIITIPIILISFLVLDRVGLKVIRASRHTTFVSSKSAQDRLAAIYTAEIGVRELTGNNDGKRVEEYLRSCGLGKGYAWCAAFVNWCHVQAGVVGAGSAWSPDWFPDKNTIYTRGNSGNKTPSKTDVLGLYYPEKKRIAHVGFIDEWGDGANYCITVEGNTNGEGSREGDGVYRKRRLKSQIYKVSRWI
jgi:hypothetical protein